jgi:heme exporter protein A
MLDVVELRCSRGERLLFSDISVTVKPGHLLAVVGENGSGKTSLLRLVCGLSLPDSGEIVWRRNPIRQLKELYRAELIYIGHCNGIKDDLTPVENLKFSACLTGDDCSDTVIRDALEAVGIGRSAQLLPTRVLSQGQKRRLALARLWVSRRPLWVLDEPFSSLDATAARLVTQRLAAHLNDGGLAVVATHQEIAVGTGSLQHLRLTG